MTFEPGDRVRCASVGEDGLPLIRYGFVRSVFDSDHGPAAVMLDGEITSEMLPYAALQPVEITTIELLLDGDDLLTDPELRRGLVGLWSGEAERAGLDVDGLVPGERQESAERWQLAVLSRGETTFVLHGFRAANGSTSVHVRARRLDPDAS